WLHPGEPVFDRFCATLLARHAGRAKQGAIFVDPHANAPYLFHLAQVTVVRQSAPGHSDLLAKQKVKRESRQPEMIESRLIGIRQERDGTIASCPVEHLLLLRGAQSIAPGSVPLARLARGMTEAARDWLESEALLSFVEHHRANLQKGLPERVAWVMRGFDYKSAELVANRQRLSEEARRGDPRASAELTRIRDRQRQLAIEKERCL